MRNNPGINSIISEAKKYQYVTGIASLGFKEKDPCADFNRRIETTTDAQGMSNLLDEMFRYAEDHNISMIDASRLLYFRNYVGEVLRSGGINPDEWLYDKLDSIINNKPKSVYHEEAPVADIVYQDELNALTDEQCAGIAIDTITRFIDSDSTGFLKNIIGDNFAKFLMRIKTDNEFSKDAAKKLRKLYSDISIIENDNSEYAKKLFDYLVELGIIDRNISEAIKCAIINDVDNNSPSKQETIEQQPAKPEEKKSKAQQQQSKPAQTEQAKKEAPEQQPIKPQPQNEQPKVAHDLRQQPQGFNIGNFMPPSQANRPQLSRIEQKYEHLKKHIKFIPNTHPNVGEDWIDFMNSFVHSDFLREKLIELGSQCNPNHPMLFEVKLEGDMSENGTYDIAFRVNCKNKKQFIIVKLSTKPVQIAGTNGFYYPADAVLMGI